MKYLIISVSLVIVTASCHNKIINNANNINQNNMVQSIEKSAIEKLLLSYRDALNASKVNDVLPLYTDDGVFMPSGAPSAIGLEQLQASYSFVFKSIQLNIEFFIDEIMIHGDYAFARTTSKGTTLIRTNGQTVPEENRELFILEKENGHWKIARYMFNKMQ